MPRIRSIKPDQPKDEALAALPIPARYLFAFLPTQADREGRLQDSARVLKLEIFPWDDIDVEPMLTALSPHFIVRYENDGRHYIQIRTFLKHQRPNNKELPSLLPAPTKEQLDERFIQKKRSLIQNEGIRECVGNGVGKGMDLVPAAQEIVSKPKEHTPQQRIVRYFKEAKGVDANDKDWDRKHWNGRLGKEANSVLKAFDGDWKKAGEYILVKGEEWKHLPDWGLNGIVSAAGRDPRLNGENDESKHVAMDAVSLDGRGRNRNFTSSGEIAGKALAGLREQASLPSPESRDLDGPGMDSPDDESFEA